MIINGTVAPGFPNTQPNNLKTFDSSELSNAKNVTLYV